MSDLENNAELKEQCASLGQQVNLLLYGLVVVSLTLAAYLGIQAKRAGTDLDLFKPQALQVVEAGKRQKIYLHEFLGKLMEYSKTHPDFQPILQKYNIKMVEGPKGAPAPGMPAVPAPAPAPAPTPAK